MLRKKGGIVAAGHTVTAEAGAEMLRAGGNAYDAILAAYLAACVAEPVLTSLGGGGYLLASHHDGTCVLYDFFVQTPQSRGRTAQPHFEVRTVNFGSTTQDFHIGHGSIATPGGVRGVAHIHRRCGSLPMSVIIEPAVRAARNGVVMNAFQAHLFDVVEPIFTASDRVRRLYGANRKDDSLAREGDVITNSAFADFLERFAREGDAFFYEGDVAEAIVREQEERGGFLTMNDLRDYTVIEREPLTVSYGESSLITNPPPSSGGILIAFALGLAERLGAADCEDEASYHALLTAIMAATNRARSDALDGHLFDDGILARFLDRALLERYAREVAARTHNARGTTHISVIDAEGNAASMTTSNGEGSAILAGETGIHLNNMLGEEDLHPNGFHQWRENERIASMMSPSVLRYRDGREVALGSGGSNRIRTAVLQVVLNLVDKGMAPREAVDAPRLHYERGEVHTEPGISPAAIEAISRLEEVERVVEHTHKGVFFGGVHAAGYNPNTRRYFGAGDMRRGGAVVKVSE